MRYAIVITSPDCSGLGPNADCVWGFATVYGSRGPGDHWRKLADLATSLGRPEALAVDAGDPDTLYLTMSGGGATRPGYVSHDRGATWTER